MITFVYKTEVSNSLDGNHFKSPRRNATDKKETSNELCSHAENEVNKLCSNNIDNVECVALLTRVDK